MIRRPTGGWKHVVPARLPTIRPVLYAAASRAYASAAQHAGLTACMTTRNLLVTCPGPSADLMHVEGPLATAIAHVRGVHAALQAPRAWGACRPAGATRQRPCRVHTGVRTWRSSQSERERAQKRSPQLQRSNWGKNNGSGNSNVWGQGDEHEVGPVAQEECALGTQAALHDCRVE